ncbi:MAG TPA: biotin/lipoyl-containing protein [Candidatus Acidoferrum sp.]|nr:biotin/lipoyl-containing protein [Candidatus Acidoferrum sp.]
MAKYDLIVDGVAVSVETQSQSDTFSATVADRSYKVYAGGNGRFLVTAQGQRRVVAAVEHKGTSYVEIDSRLFEVREPSEDRFAGAGGEHAADKDKIFAPMPGRIVKIMVALGDTVELKQPMVIVEAMKMENQVNAKTKGKVKAINFAAGDQVDTDTPIIELESLES